MDEKLYKRAREYALYSLERRDYSYKELLERLTRPPRNAKKEPIDVATARAALDSLLGIGLIDDSRYAARLAQSLLFGKRYGYYRAKAYMRAKGLDDDTIDDALRECADEKEYNAEETLEQLIQTKYAHKLETENGYQKVAAALARRGFSYYDIKAALEGEER